MAPTRREIEIAKALGVTPFGLSMLGKAATRKSGEIDGGRGSLPLVEQGYAAPADPDRHAAQAYTPRVITDKGRELVRKARTMGW